MLRSALTACMILPVMFFAAPAQAQNTAPGAKAPLQQIAAVTEDTSAASPAITVAAIGTIVEAEGPGNLILRAAESNKAYPVKNGDLVYPNDTVQTGPAAKMLVLFIDDSRFTLGENARFRADEYVYDDMDSTANKAHYNVLQGAFLYASGLIAKKQSPNVKIQTGYGSIGIRGTTVWGGVIDSQYGVFVADGEITLETNRGRIRVATGEGVTIRSLNSIPERPVIWGTEKVDRAKAEITLKDVEAVKGKIATSQTKHADMLIKHKAYRNAAQQNRIEQQKPRDSIKRLDNLPHTPAAEIKTNTPAAPAAPLPAVTEETTEAATPPAIPAAEAPIAAPVATPEPGPAKTLNDVSAPLPDAVPTTAEGAAAASAPPKNADAPEAAQAPAVSDAPVSEPTAPAGATPSIIIEDKNLGTILPVEQGKDVTPPAFPAPAPTVQPEPEDLPSDPAMRQEALEKLNLHNSNTPHNPL